MYFYDLYNTVNYLKIDVNFKAQKRNNIIVIITNKLYAEP